jgi:hypothetical protein
MDKNSSLQGRTGYISIALYLSEIWIYSNPNNPTRVRDEIKI